MSDTEVEQPFLQQLQTLGWEVIDQGQEIPSDPTRSRGKQDNQANEF